MRVRPENPSLRAAPEKGRQVGGCGSDLVVAAQDVEQLPKYRLTEPKDLDCGVVFSSPHSGRAYFQEFVEASRLDLPRLRASEDAFVDVLFNAAAEYGAPLLAAVAPRAYVDVNRGPGDLDPMLLDGPARRPSNARVAAGLGVVPRIVAEGVPIYDGKLDLQHALTRIQDWHAPYHQKLTELLEQARGKFGRALLIDCHSMPSGAAAHGCYRAAPADIVLGDRFGAACDSEIVEAVEAAFKEAGFRVARNSPFAGGYITERFGQPAAGVSAIQIEIDRGIYLEQDRIAPSDRFFETQDRLKPVISRLCQMISGCAPSARLAAE